MRTKPTKAQLNQAVRAEIPGGDFLLDMMKRLYLDRRFPERRRHPLTQECMGFFDFIENRFKSIRAKMRSAVIDRKNGIPTDPSDVCKSLAKAVADDLRNRLQNPRYCNRKKLKQDHREQCSVYLDAMKQLIDAIDGYWIRDPRDPENWIKLPQRKSSP